ncbi:MAG: TIGR02300 family protein [Candidatus Puniceispirillaceae bacterium]
MANAELGHKQRCTSCGIKFYDLNKKPITCPSCNTEFDPESLLKSRRGRGGPKQEEKAAKADADNADEEEIVSESEEDGFEEEDDVLPTEDSPIIALSSDDEEETESGSELIDVLEDDTSLGGDENDLDVSDEDEQ